MWKGILILVFKRRPYHVSLYAVHLAHTKIFIIYYIYNYSFIHVWVPGIWLACGEMKHWARGCSHSNSCTQAPLYDMAVSSPKITPWPTPTSIFDMWSFTLEEWDTTSLLIQRKKQTNKHTYKQTKNNERKGIVAALLSLKAGCGPL